VTHLLRRHAPITDKAWDEIDAEARERLTPALAARKLVDFVGPLGWEHSATNLGRVQAVEGEPVTGVQALQRRVLPLVELRAPFTVARGELRADVGVAMGMRGTDVAREAAALVLLDDDFASIVDAVRLGRRIFANLQKAMAYIVAVHVPIAGLAVLPLVFGWPLVFAPVHIVFLELVIDPVCAFVFEAEVSERDAMRRPPRPPGAPLFSARMVGWSVVQGLTTLAAVVAVLLAALADGAAADTARAMAFVTLAVANLALILVNRSASGRRRALFTRPNPGLWLVTAVAGGALALVLALPGLRALEKEAVAAGGGLIACVGAGLAVLVVLLALQHAGLGRRP